MANVALIPHLAACQILANVEGSDHCPVVAMLDVRVVTAMKSPPLCTKFMPEFSGRQQKLIAYFSRQTVASTPAVTDSQNSDKLFSSLDSETSLTAAKNKEANSQNGSSTSVNLACSVASQSLSADVTESQEEEEFNFRLFEQCPDVAINSLSDVAVSSSGTKRPAGTILTSKHSKSKKARGTGCDTGKQSNLFAFFNKPAAADAKACVRTSETNAAADAMTYPQSTIPDSRQESLENCRKATAAMCSANSGTAGKKAAVMPQISSDGADKPVDGNASAWKNLLKGPPQTPLCKGHGEPCVLRTVRKDGPNKGKQFFVCNRPEGHKNNPEARCDTFVWVSQKKN